MSSLWELPTSPSAATAPILIRAKYTLVGHMDPSSYTPTAAA